MAATSKMRNASRKAVAAVVALAVPLAASAGPTSAPAGPIKTAIETAGREIVAAQPQEHRSRARFWTSIGLIAGGAALGVLSAVEIGDDEKGPDDGEDVSGSDDGEDSDGWGNKAALSGGIAAAALGSILLMTGRKNVAPRVSLTRGGVAVRHTVRF